MTFYTPVFSIIFNGLALLLSTPAWAHDAHIAEVCENSLPQSLSRESLCKRGPKDFRRTACNAGTKLGLMNDGGLMGLMTGVCWWNSRFHRNAIYLSTYRPECPAINATTPKGVKLTRSLVERLVHARGIVEIPGYKNLWDWSTAPGVGPIIQKELQQWMNTDTFIRMQWVNGMEGMFMRKDGKHAKRKQSNEITKLEELIIRKNKLPFVVVKESGVAAHSWLVLSVERVMARPASPDLLQRRTTWVFTVIDSNHQGQSGFVGLPDGNGGIKTVRGQAPVATTYTWDGQNWYNRDSRVLRKNSNPNHPVLEEPQHQIAMIRYEQENDRLLETLATECKKPVATPCPSVN